MLTKLSIITLHSCTGYVNNMLLTLTETKRCNKLLKIFNVQDQHRNVDAPSVNYISK